MAGGSFPLPISGARGRLLVPVVIGLLLLGFTIQQIHKFPSYPDAPIDCDRFGYERQAALFRAHGLAGLDTRLETPSARRLIDAMRARAARSRAGSRRSRRTAITTSRPSTGWCCSTRPAPAS
jgi:hypothetical protein